MNQRVVLTGWGQVTQPKQSKPPFLDPIDMMEQAARDAGKLAGADVWNQVDTVLAVRTQSRNLVDPAGTLTRRLGIHPRRTHVSGIGGEVPQHFVNQAAGMLARGEANVVLICGAETYYPRSAEAVTGDAMLAQGIPDEYDADDAVGTDPLEERHGLSLPIHGFPLFENALWAKSGLSRDQWINQVGQMWAGFSSVAARHPNAWTRTPRTVDEIITPSADNRPICFPYTKRMVSLVSADIGAALIMTTESMARAMRGGGAQPVYFLGGGYAKDRQRFLVDKADFTRSPSLAAAAAKAQIRADINVAEIEGFDLYSCFPCAVSVARGELGLEERDPQTLTTTGGLGFFGGPGSNYALHGITTLAERIAEGRFQTGMSTALGWFMHKYAVGIYGNKPNDADHTSADQQDDAHPDAGSPPVDRVETFNGGGTIETYTVVYARDHSPLRGIIFGRTEAGQRFVANSETNAATFDALTQENCIGRKVCVTSDQTGVNRASLVE